MFSVFDEPENGACYSIDLDGAFQTLTGPVLLPTCQMLIYADTRLEAETSLF